MRDWRDIRGGLAEEAQLSSFVDRPEWRCGYARHLCAEGEVEGAKGAVKKAARLWPAIRLEMVDDPALAVFLGAE
jgi:hypothetical protein